MDWPEFVFISSETSSANEGFSTFWAAVLGALIGGGISFATTYYFQQRESRNKKIHQSWALYLNLMRIINDVFSVGSRYFDTLGEDQWPLQPWRVLPEIVGDFDLNVHISAEQLATISGKEAAGLVNDIIELVNFRNTILSSVVQFGEMKAVFLASIADRSELGPGMEISTTVSPKSDPAIIIKSRTLDNLARQILSNMLEFGDRVADTTEKYNNFTAAHSIKAIRSFRALFVSTRSWLSDLPLIERA